MQINHINILLVDDEYLLRQSLLHYIERMDDLFVVAAQASNGEQALEILKTETIHVVIADIRMPVMDGLELAKKVHEYYPDIIVVLLTGYADFKYAQEALRIKVFDYLLKPISEEDLSSEMIRIRAHLEKTYELPEDSVVSTRDVHANVDYAVTYMQDHYTEQLDIGSLAASMGFTSAYLTKIFNKYVGETPLKFLTNLRIREAKRLLIETSLPIREIGEKVGYPDQFHFSKTFRKLTGVNPSAYRTENTPEQST
ncbi:MAG: response regulator [Lachnospiraceae bacterium]|nr:response regulator [Lachnospiraceae bacterium]